MREFKKKEVLESNQLPRLSAFFIVTFCDFFTKNILISLEEIWMIFKLLILCALNFIINIRCQTKPESTMCFEKNFE